MWSDIIISAFSRLFYNLQSFKFKSGHQSKALVSQLIDDTDIIILGWLLHKTMHAPYTAVVMGYMLWCWTMGTDKIKKKKSLLPVFTKIVVCGCTDCWLSFLSVMLIPVKQG